MDKKALRRELAAKKRSLTAEQIETASAALAERLFCHPLYQNAGAIYLYLSYNQEVRTEPIVRRARLDGKRIAAPRVLGETMEFFWLTPETKLELSGYGIPEPVNGERADDRTALVLMPGLAFDPAGNRLGYGGGFYDRFLAREPEHPTIALCYGFQLLPQLEVESHDRPVDAVISEPII